MVKSAFIVLNDEMLNKLRPAILMVDDNISPRTIGVVIVRNDLKKFVFLTFFINIDIVNMIINEGKIISCFR
jgi:hypothetical protein